MGGLVEMKRSRAERGPDQRRAKDEKMKKMSLFDNHNVCLSKQVQHRYVRWRAYQAPRTLSYSQIL